MPEPGTTEEGPEGAGISDEELSMLHELGTKAQQIAARNPRQENPLTDALGALLIAYDATKAALATANERAASAERERDELATTAHDLQTAWLAAESRLAAATAVRKEAADLLASVVCAGTVHGGSLKRLRRVLESLDPPPTSEGGADG